MTEPAPTTWTIHLAARQPGKAVMAVLIIVLALSGIAALGASTVVLVIAAVLLLVSISDFLLPITYTLDRAGVHARTPVSHRFLSWERVRWVYLRPKGIILSPLTVRGWMESYRGVSLRTPDRDAILAQIRAWLQVTGATPEILEEI